MSPFVISKRREIVLVERVSLHRTFNTIRTNFRLFFSRWVTPAVWFVALYGGFPFCKTDEDRRNTHVHFILVLGSSAYERRHDLYAHVKHENR